MSPYCRVMACLVFTLSSLPGRWRKQNMKMICRAIQQMTNKALIRKRTRVIECVPSPAPGRVPQCRTSSGPMQYPMNVFADCRTRTWSRYWCVLLLSPGHCNNCVQLGSARTMIRYFAKVPLQGATSERRKKSIEICLIAALGQFHYFCNFPRWQCKLKSGVTTPGDPFNCLIAV